MWEMKLLSTCKPLFIIPSACELIECCSTSVSRVRPGSEGYRPPGLDRTQTLLALGYAFPRIPIKQRTQGLKAECFNSLLYGLKPIPTRTKVFPQPVKPVPSMLDGLMSRWIIPFWCAY
jgi:hypothetical protein